MKLSEFFTLEELIFSETASRYNIDNRPSKLILPNLINTAEKMDVVRRYLNNPIIISSGYRCQELNSKIGSKSTSQHTMGLAVDFKCPRFGTPKEIVNAILTSGIVFDQMILEFNSWVHLSFVENNNRKQTLIIDSSGTRPY